VSHPLQVVGDVHRESSITWRAWALGTWLMLAALAAVRLVLGIGLGLDVARRAEPLDDEGLGGAAALAAARLGLGRQPELRASARVRCPAIWCWGRIPVILLPASDGAVSAGVDWVGVFCHELAHWVRRDHASSLLAELAACVLPWHPLVWLARLRLGQLSELACDDWALSTGLPAADYAESLLGLVPQRPAALALTAVSSRRGLIGRVHHILAGRQISPEVGTRWGLLSAFVVVLAASAVALAQSRPAEMKRQGQESGDGERSLQGSKPASASGKPASAKHTIRGAVLGPDDKPVAGASVLLLGYTRPAVSFVAMPKDRKDQRGDPREVVLAGTTAGADGRYVLTANLSPDDLNSLFVVAVAPGFAIRGQYLKKYRESIDASRLDSTEQTLRLASQVPIRGRLLTPAGTPAAGVRVTLNRFHDGETDAMGIGMTPTDDRVPSYWPKPVTTDANGRFVLEGVPRGSYATLDIWPSEYAVDDVTVNTAGDGATTPSLRAFEITPVGPTFTHTLEPARPVQGRVTDKQTGKPLPGLLVEMIPMRRHGGMPFHARTDADGRYRISGHQADTYITTVYPPADSGYLATKDWQRSWPAGARFLEKNFALDKGRIVHGRVIDADTKKPVAGAAVIYQPGPNNPNDHDYELRNTVLTDQEGRFAITTLAGPGNLAVETPDETYMRVSHQGPYFHPSYPQAMASVVVPRDGEPNPVEITVRKGFPLEARVVGPDGKPVASFTAFYPGIDAALLDVWNQGRPYENGLFRIPNADPKQSYRVYFIEPEHQLGAVVDLKPDPQAKQPVEVKLQPAAKVRGKLVTASGSPVGDAQANPMLVIHEKQAGEMKRDDLFRNTEIYANVIGSMAMMAYDERKKPNPRGEFVIDTLVPGARFYIMAGSGSLEAEVAVPTLKPGEDRDIGTITLKERKP
jgi:beta-lactamase regulating signal transducer with metallopeptidase domain/5-hydroxyisourate hydrolase-like protein (transthyretin family)